MGQLQTDLKQLEDAGIRIVAISYDTVDILKQYTEQNKIGYLMLSDEGSKTIDAYGIRNTDIDANSRVYGIPFPGTILVDRDGTIRAKLYEEDYKIRHTTPALIEAAKMLD